MVICAALRRQIRAGPSSLSSRIRSPKGMTRYAEVGWYRCSRMTVTPRNFFARYVIHIWVWWGTLKVVYIHICYGQRRRLTPLSHGISRVFQFFPVTCTAVNAFRWSIQPYYLLTKPALDYTFAAYQAGSLTESLQAPAVPRMATLLLMYNP